MGRDENGKQIFKCKTGYPFSDLSVAKANKQANIEAELWGQEIKKSMNAVKEYSFDEFANDVWWASIQNGTRKQTSESDLPHRRFDPECCFPLCKRDHQKMDDAGAGLGLRLQSDHDFLRRPVCGLKPGLCPGPRGFYAWTYRRNAKRLTF